MQSVILDFESKVEEIEEYFNFIETTTHLERDFDKEKIVKVSETVYDVLKANIFLLLYNLIESSFKNALEKICIEITNDRLTYKEVIPEIKRLWLEKHYKNFENIKIPKNIKKSEHIMNTIDNITEDIIEINFYIDEKKRKNDDISGNVDAREISRINQKYGAKLRYQPKDIDKQALQTVKIQRNNLAHGDETFRECGRDKTLETLGEIKSNSIEYMRFILSHIKKFIENKEYKLIAES
jgi:hypothetical protein